MGGTIPLPPVHVGARGVVARLNIVWLEVEVRPRWPGARAPDAIVDDLDALITIIHKDTRTCELTMHHTSHLGVQVVQHVRNGHNDGDAELPVQGGLAPGAREAVSQAGAGRELAYHAARRPIVGHRAAQHVGDVRVRHLGWWWDGGWVVEG